MLFSLVTSVVIVYGVPRPVLLVLTASALAFFIAPVVFFLNVYYCVTIIPKTDRRFYPSTIQIWLSWISLAVFTVLTIVVVQARDVVGDIVRQLLG